MDLQLFLGLNALTLSAMAIAAIVIYRPGGGTDWLADNGPWLAINAVVVGVGGLTLWLAPDWTGWTVLSLFLPFVVAPVVLFNLSQRQANAGRAARAAHLAYAGAVLHPTASNWVNAHLLAALSKSDATNTQALEVLAATAPPQYRPIVQAHLAVVRRDWSEILALAVPDGPADSIMKPLEIRALGETGATDAMVRCYWASQRKLTGNSALMPQLVTLAFGGRPAPVERLLARRFPGLDAEAKSYWTAVANLNSGTETASGKRALESLAAGAASATARVAAQRRLAALATQPVPQQLRTETTAGLDAITALVMTPAPSASAAPAFAFPVTLVLIVLNIAAFLAELVTGNAEDSATLIRLGALWPPDVLEHGQWWRLLSCTFLHFGAIHIISNMFVLFVLGRMLELIIGWPRMLAIYLVGGIASSAFVLWLMWAEFTDYGLLVGASGAIFALFGAEVALVLKEWRAAKGGFDNRRLTMLGVILAIQMSIDLSVPSISFSAHASGFLTGLLLMIVWPPRSGLPQTVSPSTPPPIGPTS